MEINQKKYSGEYVGEIHYKMIKDALSALPSHIKSIVVSPATLTLIQSATFHKPTFFEKNRGFAPVGVINDLEVFIHTCETKPILTYDEKDAVRIEFINISFS